MDVKHCIYSPFIKYFFVKLITKQLGNRFNQSYIAQYLKQRKLDF